MNQVLLEATGLRKSFGARQAVADVSLTVAAGEVLGLLGPNGAGKSTTVGMISGLTPPDGGTVTIRGTRLAADDIMFKRHIGLVPQELALFEDLSAIANLELFGALYALPRQDLTGRAMAVLETVGLDDRAREKPSTFSGGMKRRLNIACALIHDPDVLLLDEPTAGVDPQSRNAIFVTLESLRRAGKAMVYTTHYMEEAERLADRLMIIDHGRVVATGTCAELYEMLPAAQTLQIDADDVGDPASLQSALQSVDGVKRATVQRRSIEIGLDDLAQTTASVTNLLAALGIGMRQISSGRGNLEDVFLQLTGRQLRD